MLRVGDGFSVDAEGGGKTIRTAESQIQNRPFQIDQKSGLQFVLADGQNMTWEVRSSSSFFECSI